jgi:hypothetical protein
MKSLTVYVITQLDGTTTVRTRPIKDRPCVPATIKPKALRTIARAVLRKS